MKYLHHIFIPLIFVGISFCTTTDAPDRSTDYEIRMRLPEEPARLNPIISSNAYETQLLNMIFMPLAEFDPYTLEYRPVLVESLNDKQILGEDDPYAGEAIYDFRIREDAIWHDGKSILASDYLFTAKTVLIPQLNSSSWLGYLINILDIRLDPQDPKVFQVVVEQGIYACSADYL